MNALSGDMLTYVCMYVTYKHTYLCANVSVQIDVFSQHQFFRLLTYSQPHTNTQTPIHIHIYAYVIIRLVHTCISTHSFICQFSFLTLPLRCRIADHNHNDDYVFIAVIVVYICMNVCMFDEGVYAVPTAGS